ncbi:hypothetical protein COOONC_13724, partial [Cooperia oncophora]
LILLRGGNAVDAAISTIFCLSAALPHRGGLGGGFMATIYSDSTCTTLNSRETCPSAASETYFLNRRDETVDRKQSLFLDFLSGLYRAFEGFASKRLTWRQLLTPTIELCVRGLNSSTKQQEKFLAKGSKMFCPQLANFLSDICDSENPVEYFYRGEGSMRLLKAINEEEAFISAQDLDDFETERQYGLQSHVGSVTLCGPQPPSLFTVVQLAVKAMQSRPLETL